MTDVLLILKIMQMISLEIEVGLYQYLSLKLIILKTWRMNLILMLLRIKVLNVKNIAGLHVNPDLFGKSCLYPDAGVSEMLSLEIVSPVSGYKPVYHSL